MSGTYLRNALGNRTMIGIYYRNTFCNRTITVTYFRNTVGNRTIIGIYCPNTLGNQTISGAYLRHTLGNRTIIGAYFRNTRGNRTMIGTYFRNAFDEQTMTYPVHHFKVHRVNDRRPVRTRSPNVPGRGQTIQIILCPVRATRAKLSLGQRAGLRQSHSFFNLKYQTHYFCSYYVFCVITVNTVVFIRKKKYLCGGGGPILCLTHPESD